MEILWYVLLELVLVVCFVLLTRKRASSIIWSSLWDGWLGTILKEMKKDQRHNRKRDLPSK